MNFVRQHTENLPNQAKSPEPAGRGCGPDFSALPQAARATETVEERIGVPSGSVPRAQL